MHCIALYLIALHCIVLYCIVLYCSIFRLMKSHLLLFWLMIKVVRKFFDSFVFFLITRIYSTSSFNFISCSSSLLVLPILSIHSSFLLFSSLLPSRSLHCSSLFLFFLFIFFILFTILIRTDDQSSALMNHLSQRKTW